ncbi:CehA/McbA family metallohydrolase [Dyella tabacisoli]|uniref:PHP domain-containing protein n=1 Tax=Dyella tabacisoli TaxID=2282381 RepID=A0A369UKJ1_9GAMM|nr:CehA/McbA family metallohydrolase [Dyella tabacisoli]RDD80833.1 PHP domain-containing protein [Dyella tabacisoli]
MNQRHYYWLTNLLAGLVLLLSMLTDTRAADVHVDRTSPDLVLRGELSGKDNQTYRNLPFDVPAGTTRITVQFDYSGRDQHTTVDLGLLGPDGAKPQGFGGQDGFRGWSGGSKRLFTVSATDATPSYLPGPIRPGRWTLLLGIPNIRKDSHASYTASLWFGRANDAAWEPALLNPPLRKEAGWYRGDLHMHTAHSDGSCNSQGGERVPCPLFLTVQGAVQRGLDFIAITEHNTTSHANAMRELQPYFDRLLLIPGREVTSFTGHANLFGTTAPVDFRVGSPGVPDWNSLLRAIAPLHGLISINHAIRPSGEACMGCGWTAKPAVDMALVQAIEIVNGIDAGTPFSGVPFWEQQLAKGYRLTGIGGSDSHNAFQNDPKNSAMTSYLPTTVVHANELSMPAILDGIRAGHVFVDVEGSKDRLLELTAHRDRQQASMGDALSAPAGATVTFEAHVAHVIGATLTVWLDGKPLTSVRDSAIKEMDQRIRFDWTADGKPHWLRAEVRDASSRPLLIGNPIYLTAAANSF